MSEQALSGGNMNRVVRVGDTVRRPAGAWTPTVQRLLRHARERGVTWTPEPLGYDKQGRKVLTFITCVFRNQRWVGAIDFAASERLEVLTAWTESHAAQTAQSELGAHAQMYRGHAQWLRDAATYWSAACTLRPFPW